MATALPDEVLLDVFQRATATATSTPTERVRQLRRLLWVAAQWRRVACDVTLWRGVELDLRTAGILAQLGALLPGSSLCLLEAETRLLRERLMGDGTETLRAPVDVGLVPACIAALTVCDVPARDSLEDIFTASTATWPALRRLTLRRCTLSDVCVEIMAPRLGLLTDLRVSACPTGNYVLHALLTACNDLDMLDFDPRPIGVRWRLPSVKLQHAKLCEFVVGSRFDGHWNDEFAVRPDYPLFPGEDFPNLEVINWCARPLTDEGLFGDQNDNSSPPPRLKSLRGVAHTFMGLLLTYPCLTSITFDLSNEFDIWLERLEMARVPALRQLTLINCPFRAPAPPNPRFVIWLNNAPHVEFRAICRPVYVPAGEPLLAWPGMPVIAAPGDTSGDEVVGDLEAGIVVRAVRLDAAADDIAGVSRLEVVFSRDAGA